MKQSNYQLELLKQILENLRFPERLDAHPWVDSLTVLSVAAAAPPLVVGEAPEPAEPPPAPEDENPSQEPEPPEPPEAAPLL